MTLHQSLLHLADLAKESVGDSILARIAYNEAVAAALEGVDAERSRDAAKMAETLRHLEEKQVQFWADLMPRTEAAR